jgi:hypothetical protein
MSVSNRRAKSRFDSDLTGSEVILGPTQSENNYMYYVFYVKRLMSEVFEFKPLKSGVQWNYVLGGDLNPFLGFYFPLFSMVFPWEFPSGWKTTESSGKKIVVNCSHSTYKF